MPCSFILKAGGLSLVSVAMLFLLNALSLFTPEGVYLWIKGNHNAGGNRGMD